MGICIHTRSCHNLIGGYLCDCLPGWEGPNCDISEQKRNFYFWLSTLPLHVISYSISVFCREQQLSGSLPKQWTVWGNWEHLLSCPLSSWLDYSLLDFFPPLFVKDLVSGSRCVCPPGFSGMYCQNALSLCDSAPCLHGGQCVETDGRTISCICPTGYSGNLCEVGNFSFMFNLE